MKNYEAFSICSKCFVKIPWNVYTNNHFICDDCMATIGEYPLRTRSDPKQKTTEEAEKAP